MLVNCKQGCKNKRISTTVSLDLENDEAICDYCGDSIEISPFSKAVLKRNGKVLRKSRKGSFQYGCTTCKETISTEVVNGELRGVGCSGECKFDISRFTLHAIKTSIESSKKESDQQDEG